MANPQKYTINLPKGTNGTSLDVDVPYGQTVATYSVDLVGRAAPSYGETFAENFVRLLTNSASDAGGRPTAPLIGELWYNHTIKGLMCFVGVGATGADIYGWSTVSSSTTILPITAGGTGANTAAGALANLGAVAKAGDTMTGSLTVPALLRVTQTSGPQQILIGNQDSQGAGRPAAIYASNGQLTLGSGTSWTTGGAVTGLFLDSTNDVIQWKGGTVWNANNDGPNSGLDADLLDGQHGAYYSNAANLTGTVPLARLPYTPVQQGGGANQLNNKIYLGWGGNGRLRLQVDSTDFGDTSWPIDINGRAAVATTADLATEAIAARYLKANAQAGGTNMAFNWSGQGGQPTWLWGGNDVNNMYVYNPANFSVAQAANATNATNATNAANVPWTGISGARDNAQNSSISGADVITRASNYYVFNQGTQSPGPQAFPTFALSGFDAVSNSDFGSNYWTGITCTGPSGTRSMQLAANWNAEETAPYGLMFRVNDDTADISSWGPWTNIWNSGNLKNISQLTNDAGYVNSSSFTQSFSTFGWVRFPNGLIIQWGRGNFGHGTFIPYPFAFPNALFNVYGSDRDGRETFGSKNATNNGFTLQTYAGTLAFSWMAIGY